MPGKPQSSQHLLQEAPGSPAGLPWPVPPPTLVLFITGPVRSPEHLSAATRHALPRQACPPNCRHVPEHPDTPICLSSTSPNQTLSMEPSPASFEPLIRLLTPSSLQYKRHQTLPLCCSPRPHPGSGLSALTVPRVGLASERRPKGVHRAHRPARSQGAAPARCHRPSIQKNPQLPGTHDPQGNFLTKAGTRWQIGLQFRARGGKKGIISSPRMPGTYSVNIQTSGPGEVLREGEQPSQGLISPSLKHAPISGSGGSKQRAESRRADESGELSPEEA